MAYEGRECPAHVTSILFQCLGLCTDGQYESRVMHTTESIANIRQTGFSSDESLQQGRYRSQEMNFSHKKPMASVGMAHSLPL